tara:strand:+ start:3903 stop:4823 length:921 start_codon:yes stop_codon:yes gene_type:complete
MLKIDKFSPVALFVYNRVEHAQLTIASLQKNHFVDQTDLIIFSDGPKSAKDLKDVLNVRKYISQVSGFRSVRVIEQSNNLGLASSIISGVTKLLSEHTAVIVLEDDIITSPAFLSYMNQALNFFSLNQKIWHINGFSHPISQAGLKDIYLNRVMDCWGWATWSDRWKFFDRNPELLLERMDISSRQKFDLHGTNEFWPQVTKNITREINTWAIFWYAEIFLRGGLCVSPSKSYTRNIGFDGSGTHCNDENSSQSMLETLNLNQEISFEVPLEENLVAIKRIREVYTSRKNIFTRLRSKLKLLISWH